jgi:hypothetical protein
MNLDNMSYDELYDLFGGPPTTPGIPAERLKTLPTYIHPHPQVGGSEVDAAADAADDTGRAEAACRCEEDTACSICLMDYEPGEELMGLPLCGHTYHSACIGKWLAQQGVCPICRTDIACAVAAEDPPAATSTAPVGVEAAAAASSSNVGVATSDVAVM